MPDRRGWARRTLRGIDEQVAKAEGAVAGKTPVKRNRFVQLSGGTRSVNRALETKARALAGLKGYVTNLEARRYRTLQIQAGNHTITAADSLPDDLRDTLNRIHRRSGTHQVGPTRVVCPHRTLGTTRDRRSPAASPAVSEDARPDRTALSLSFKTRQRDSVPLTVGASRLQLLG